MADCIDDFLYLPYTYKQLILCFFVKYGLFPDDAARRCGFAPFRYCEI